MVAQGALPFQYVEDRKSNGATSLGGLPVYMELAMAAGLRRSVSQHVAARGSCGQGWTDAEMVLATVLLNLAGGDAVDDFDALESDEGFALMLERTKWHGLPRDERRALERRWRKSRERAVPSPSAVFRYLELFHDEGQEAERRPGKAFIPRPKPALDGLVRVNADMVAFAQRVARQEVATLDMDATLVATHKRTALFCYKGFRAYQPLNTWWAEHGLVLHSEFRDGNVPAGHEQLRVLKEALGCLPPDVKKVQIRSDTAAYQVELLQYLAQGANERFGVIEFAISADVTPEFRRAVAELPASAWNRLQRRDGSGPDPSGHEWAEVVYVPNWAGHSKKGPAYRFLAIREPLRQLDLPGVGEQASLPFPTMEFGEGGRHKVFGVVTNRTLHGDALIHWHRERCGKSEEAHAVMKTDLAGGQLPSGKFGANAAWWAMMLIAFNLNVIMKKHALGGTWAERRLKALRFGFIRIAGWVVDHARQLEIRVNAGHPALRFLARARKKILSWLKNPDPPR
jgi:hypothetical protein